MDPKLLMMRLSEAVPKNVVVVEEGLTSTFPLLNYLPLRDHQGFYGLASGGIGFAMAGAVGISIALPNRPVVAIVGDGSAMYSIQALWTAAHLKLPITYVVPNNRSYRILKERLVSFRKTEKFIGMDMDDPAIDFVALAQSMGVPARRITDPQDVGPALRESLQSGGPRLLDVTVANGFGA
jgi:benzoylformate decarboxylase